MWDVVGEGFTVVHPKNALLLVQRNSELMSSLFCSKQQIHPAVRAGRHGYTLTDSFDCMFCEGGETFKRMHMCTYTHMILSAGKLKKRRRRR